MKLKPLWTTKIPLLCTTCHSNNQKATILHRPKNSYFRLIFLGGRALVQVLLNGLRSAIIFLIDTLVKSISPSRLHLTSQWKAYYQWFKTLQKCARFNPLVQNNSGSTHMNGNKTAPGAGPLRDFIGLWAHCSRGFIGLWAHCSLDRIGFWRSFWAHEVGEPPTSRNVKKICILIFAKIPFAHIYIYT